MINNLKLNLACPIAKAPLKVVSMIKPHLLHNSTSLRTPRTGFTVNKIMV